MVSKSIQIKYNQVIDNIAYLIVHHPELLKKLLKDHGVSFEAKYSHKDLSDAVIEQLEQGNVSFQNTLEALIKKLSSSTEDQFISALISGAVGVVGGLIKKKQAKRNARRASAAAAREDQLYNRSQAAAAAKAQAAAARRDLELRMERIREQSRLAAERQRKEQEVRRRKEEERKREADATKKTNMMLIVGGGIAVLGIGAVVFMKSNRPPMIYPSMRPPVTSS